MPTSDDGDLDVAGHVEAITTDPELRRRAERRHAAPPVDDWSVQDHFDAIRGYRDDPEPDDAA